VRIPVPALRALLIVSLAFLLALPTPAASQDGSGPIREPNLVGTANIGSLNPLLCDNAACRRITSFLFPHLIGIDPTTGQFTPSGDSTALAASWDISADGTKYTIHLRDDLTWTDGTPITALDVFYSGYFAITSRFVQSAELVDDYSIVFSLSEANCSALNWLDFPVIPVHMFEPDFANRIDSWLDASLTDQAQVLLSSHFNSSPTVTAGLFEFDTLQPTEYIRLQMGDLGFSYEDVSGWDEAVARFMDGRLNFIQNPPFSRRQDLRAASGVQIVEYPGLTWSGIALNFADPANPRGAYDDDGNLVDQGHHPLFSDPQVRRAMQFGINVNTLIDSALLGSGTVMAANQSPSSWAADSTLAPVPYDPDQARHILESAGWKDTNHDGIRECITCTTADPGTLLSFELLYDDMVSYHSVMVSLISQQLAQVGFYVYTAPVSYPPDYQYFDAYLFSATESFPVNPDQSLSFTRAGDDLDGGSNYGSYFNPEIEDLFAQAKTVCDPTARADIYHQIQSILQSDQPYIWLFTVNDLLAVRDGVSGFDPYPQAPFWNILDWKVQQ